MTKDQKIIRAKLGLLELAKQIEAEPQAAKPAGRPLPDHPPREEIVHPAACACPACGGALRPLGSDVTETLDHLPGRFRVVRHVREAFSCRACEAVVQAPAPNHAIARDRAGAGLLAHILVAKFDDHLPLHRQAEIYAREGLERRVGLQHALTVRNWWLAAPQINPDAAGRPPPRLISPRAGGSRWPKHANNRGGTSRCAVPLRLPPSPSPPPPGPPRSI